MQDLRISLVQGATVWHDPARNRAYYAGLIAPLHGMTDVVLLPETFTSGFSNDAIDQAETMTGATVTWMQTQARALGAVICGSVQLRADADNDAPRVFNRLLWVAPDGRVQYYDKRHLFRYANEHTRYAAGRERLIVEYKGWRICPLVCYDLRFPVFSRNQFNLFGSNSPPLAAVGCTVPEEPLSEAANTPPLGAGKFIDGRLEYDLLLYVANWPSTRAYAWKTLLRARAIENLCYVAGLNRVGEDGNGLHYTGDSAVIDFLGHPVSECTDAEVVVTTTLQAAGLTAHRQCFPAMLDADGFSLLD